MRMFRYEFLGIVNQKLKLASDLVRFTSRLQKVVPGLLEQPQMFAKLIYELGKLP